MNNKKDAGNVTYHLGWQCGSWEFTGDLPISIVHAYVNEKICYLLYLVPYGTIVDPSQVSLV